MKSLGKTSLFQWLRVVLWQAFVIAIVLSGCAPQKKQLTSECVVNSDQANLFTGHWTARPIPLSVQAVDFSASELDALEAAIATWNDFFQESKGFQLYLNGSSPLGVSNSGGTRITASTACSQTVVSGSNYTKPIFIYKKSSGWSNSQSGVMALTSVCPVVTANSSLRMFVSGVMEINYQHFFGGGQPVPDLQSIVTHELGHLLGLGHSCSSCVSAPNEYKEAVMYPSLGFTGNVGQSKRNLGINDQERANCLY